MPISNEDIYKLLQTVSSQNQEIKEEILNINSKITNITAEVERINKKYFEIEEENIKLRNKVQELQKKSKKYNIVIYGLDEEEAETPNSVISLFEQLEVPLLDKNEIRDAYRIGKKNDGKARPTIVELQTFMLKIKLLNKAKENQNLRKAGIYITNDYTQEEYSKRKFLYSHLKEARNKGLSAKIKNDNLIVSGDVYKYEDLIKDKSYLVEKSKQSMPNHRPQENNNKPPSPPLEKTHGSAPNTPTVITEDFLRPKLKRKKEKIETKHQTSRKEQNRKSSQQELLVEAV